MSVGTSGPFEGSEGVQTGDNRILEKPLTTTATPPFTLSVVAMENDSGSPAEASAAVEKGMKDGTAKLTAAFAGGHRSHDRLRDRGRGPAALGIVGGPLADGVSALAGMACTISSVRTASCCSTTTNRKKNG